MARYLKIVVLLVFFILNDSGKSSNAGIFAEGLKLHPVHVSYANVEYHKEDQQFKLLFKIFSNDFALIVQQKYGIQLNLNSKILTKEENDAINRYIKEHFRIEINNSKKSQKLKLSKIKLQDKAIWIYYYFKYSGKSHNFNVWNSLMTDLYPDQTNLLIFTFNDYQRAIRFTNKKKLEKIVF